MAFVLTTQFDLRVLVKPGGDSSADWTFLESGPGTITIEDGLDVCVRIKNIKDDDLYYLIKELSGCTALTYLDLAENRNITDEGTVRLAGLTSLTHLNLSSCSIHDVTLQTLAEMKRLIWLNLSYCHRLTGTGLRWLKALPNLQYLDLQGSSRITKADIRRIERRGLVIHE